MIKGSIVKIKIAYPYYSYYRNYYKFQVVSYQIIQKYILSIVHFSYVDDAGNDIQMQDSNEDTNALGAKFDSTNLDIKDLQYLQTVIVNHMDEHDDS